MGQIDIINVLKDAKKPLCIIDIAKLTGIGCSSISLAINKIKNIEKTGSFNKKNRPIICYSLKND